MALTSTVEHVAAYVRARTKNKLGVEVGTFNSELLGERERTRPSAEQVEQLLTDAVGTVISDIGTDDPCTAPLTAKANGLVALRAAMQVELTYFPEQVAQGRSPYKELKELYDDDVEKIVKGIAANCGGGGDSGSTDDTVLPSFGYEIPTQVVGRKTVW